MLGWGSSPTTASVRASGSGDRRLGGKVTGPVSLWEQALWTQGAATPQDVSQLLQEVDRGVICQFVDFVHSLREKDGHLHNCISIFEAQVGGGKWVAIPQSSKQVPRKSELKQARILEAVMAELEGWPSALAHLASEGEQFGHGTIELVWGVYDGDNPLLRGWFIPRVAYRVDTRRFGFRSSDGRLLFDSVGLGTVDIGGVDLEEFPAGKFVTHQVRVTGDVQTREGAGRVTAWLAIFRNWDLRGWLECGEQAWKPYRVATYDKVSDDATVALANEIVERVVAGGGVAKPDTIALDVTWPKFSASQGTSQQKELFETLGMELSKAWLGHTLLTESGSRGARSLGEVGWDVSMVRKVERSRALAATLYLQLVRPIFSINAPGKRAPFLVPDLGEQADMREFCAGLKDLVGGARMPVQTSWVRQQLRIPDPQQGEEMLGGALDSESGGSEQDGDEGDEGEIPDNPAEDSDDAPDDEGDE